MSDLTLAITQPIHGSALAGPVPLTGTASGSTSGMFFKWFSSLNSAGTQTHPEINTVDHSLASLNFTTAVLSEFGSHAVVLSATDQDGLDLPSIKAVTRSALAGGAPPAAPAPCVVHQLSGAVILNPASDGLTLSKAGATIDVLAPGTWLKPDLSHPGQWIANTDYQAMNGVALTLHFEPNGPPDAAHSADIVLALTSLPVFRQNDKTYLRYTGPLPTNLGIGNYRLILIASAGTRTASVTRLVVLAA
jgi:hypothetical protein